MSYNFVRFLFIIIACLRVIPASAQDYRVGVESMPYLPYYEIKDDRYSGFIRSVLDEFAEDYGYDLTYMATPVNRLNMSLRDNIIDFRVPDNPSWQKDKKRSMNISYSEPIISSVAGLNFLATKYKEQEPVRTIGMVLGFSALEYQREIVSGEIAVVTHREFSKLIEMALYDRIDAIYGDPKVLEYNLSLIGLPKSTFVFSATHPHSEHGYHISTRNHPDFIEKFNAWMKTHPAKLEDVKRRFALD